MPDAREEVLRAFTRQGEVATAHGNCVPADELVFRKVQHIDARAMADEILSLRAARDAAQREREEREETIRELGDVLQHICELYSPSADHSQYMRSHAQAAITKGGAYLNRRAELNEERMNRIAAEFQRDAALAEVERLKAAPTCVEVVAGGGSLLRYKLSGDTLTVWVGNGMSLAPDDAQGARIEALCTTWAMKWDRERAALPAAAREARIAGKEQDYIEAVEERDAAQKALGTLTAACDSLDKAQRWAHDVHDVQRALIAWREVLASQRAALPAAEGEG